MLRLKNAWFLSALSCAICVMMITGCGSPVSDDPIKPMPTPTPSVVIAKPTFTPEAGTYNDSVTVSISCTTPQVEIRCCTDGSNLIEEPNGGSTMIRGTKYTDPLVFYWTTTVKALAFDSRGNISEITSATYTIRKTSPTPTPALTSSQKIEDSFRMALDSVSDSSDVSKATDALDQAVREVIISDPNNAAQVIQEAVASQINSSDDARTFFDLQKAMGGRTFSMDLGSAGTGKTAKAGETKKVHAIYVNGVRTSYQQALQEDYPAILKMLNNYVIGKTACSIGRFSLSLIYNMSATDKERSTWGGTVCPLAYTYSPSIMAKLLLYVGCSSVGGFVVDIGEAAVDKVREWFFHDSENGIDPINISNQVREYLDSSPDWVVVLIGHSQGNFKIEQAVTNLWNTYDREKLTKRVAIVGIGCPASYENAISFGMLVKKFDFLSDTPFDISTLSSTLWKNVPNLPILDDLVAYFDIGKKEVVKLLNQKWWWPNNHDLTGSYLAQAEKTIGEQVRDYVDQLGGDIPTPTPTIVPTPTPTPTPTVTPTATPTPILTPTPTVTPTPTPTPTPGGDTISVSCGGVQMTLIKIPHGLFRMGDIVGGGDTDERPVHNVTITKGYYMGIYEVTQAQWKATMGTEPWKGQPLVKEQGDCPATYVTWSDAVAFCTKLGQSNPGKTFRLPTEAEWERACRASTETVYYFGNDSSALSSFAWWDGNAWSANEKYAHPVGQKTKNSFGLFDMHGNVWEWCSDWYSSSYYGTSPASDPGGPSSGNFRVLRGGSLVSTTSYCRSSLRGGGNPVDSGMSCGFRVVLGDETPSPTPTPTATPTPTVTPTVTPTPSPTPAPDGDYPKKLTTEIAVDTGPHGVALSPDGAYLYVACCQGGAVSVVRTSDNTHVTSISNPGAVDVAVRPDGSFLYVSGSTQNQVSVIGTSDYSVSKSLSTGQYPWEMAVTPDGSKVYVANHRSNTVSVVRTSDHTVTNTISVGLASHGIDITHRGDFVYVANGDGNSVSVISTATDAVTATVNVGDGPYSVLLTPDDSFAYVPNSRDNTVSVLQTSSNTVIKTISVDQVPIHAAVTPDGRYVFVSNYESGTVSVIRTQDNAVVDTLSVVRPRDLIVSRDGNVLYVASWEKNSVYVFGK